MFINLCSRVSRRQSPTGTSSYFPHQSPAGRRSALPGQALLPDGPWASQPGRTGGSGRLGARTAAVVSESAGVVTGILGGEINILKLSEFCYAVNSKPTVSDFICLER